MLSENQKLRMELTALLEDYKKEENSIQKETTEKSNKIVKIQEALKDQIDSKLSKLVSKSENSWNIDGELQPWEREIRYTEQGWTEVEW